MNDTNVLGTPLQPCSLDPLTGFYRTGCCETGPDDLGAHLVCVQVNDLFLAFSRELGNDLSTPHPAWGFPGLKPGDRWCLCLARWQQALAAGVAPPIILEATHAKVLEVLPLALLREHALLTARA